MIFFNLITLVVLFDDPNDYGNKNDGYPVFRRFLAVLIELRLIAFMLTIPSDKLNHIYSPLSL
jgi:hypothetical protein